VDGPQFIARNRTAVVLRDAQDVHDAAERALADGHRDRRAGGLDGEAALEAFGSAHRDGAHDAVAELLLHFEGEVSVGQLQRLVDLGDRVAREFHVDDGADDLGDLACSHG
jgi:hypothetical protein